MSNQLYEYIGTAAELKNAVVTIERETDKSYFVNYRPMVVEVEQRRVSKSNLKPHKSLNGM